MPASALRTHVCTAAQPPPSILWPFWASAHVTKLAHHGLPGGTPAALRYSSTLAPVLVPSSFTPSWVSAVFKAAAPRLLLPDPGSAAAAASTAAGTDPGGASALAGPTGRTAMNAPESPFLPPAGSAFAARN